MGIYQKKREINVIDESQAGNWPVPVQEAEIRWKKFLSPAILFVVLSGSSKASSGSPLRLSQLGELHVKAGYVSTLLAGEPS